SYALSGPSTGTMHGGPMTSESSWDGQTFVVKSVVKLNQDLVLADYWSLSADGNTLTFREVSKFGTSPENDSTRFFTKKPDAAWDPNAFTKPASTYFTNLKLFKELPTRRLTQVMGNISTWLGVQCNHCHDTSDYSKDDKKPKETARKMFAMVQKLNQE